MTTKQSESVPAIAIVEGVRGYVDANGTAQLNVEDVARGLGFTQTAKSGNEVVRWERVNRYLREFGFIPTSGDDVKAGDYIPENIFYRLAMKASNEAAQKFQKKIADEILPEIRKTGVYMTAQAAEKILLNPDFIIQLAQQVKLAQKERDEFKALAAAKEEEIQGLKPDAEYARRILQSKEALSVTIIAKDYGYSAATFNLILAKYKIQHRVGNAWVINEPYSKMGYTKSETLIIKEGIIKTLTRWTQKGRMWLYNALKKHGIIPVCEREIPMATLI